jgi:hypothetical protein
MCVVHHRKGRADKLNPPSYYPKDLAREVATRLHALGVSPPERTILQQLLDTLFFVSLRAEEGQPITCHVAYIDPVNPDPDPPHRIRRDRWKYVPFTVPLQFTESNLVKVARATDMRSSSLAIYPGTDSDLMIWGLVDQGNSFFGLLNYEREGGFDRPGMFQVSIDGIGRLTVFFGFSKIAELRGKQIRTGTINVLEDGPVQEALSPILHNLSASVTQRLQYEHETPYEVSHRAVARFWQGVISRLLLRIQNFSHGGTLLVTPDESMRHLDIKYGMSYERLHDSITEYSAQATVNQGAYSEILREHVEPGSDTIPTDLYFDESISQGELEDTRNEIDDVIWFISLLTRVDGLVLMNQHFHVLGFGVMITGEVEPVRLVLAGDAQASVELRMPMDYSHFGTRHRSIMQYCWKVPGSVGFVVSQDRDVRVFTRSGDDLVMWENIELQNVFFEQAHTRVAIRNEPSTGEVVLSEFVGKSTRNPVAVVRIDAGQYRQEIEAECLRLYEQGTEDATAKEIMTVRKVVLRRHQLE